MWQLRNSQRGMSSVEFAIVGAVFFTVLFAVVEFGRLMFVMNTLDEVTRRGARLAAVCPYTSEATTYVKNQAMFNGTIVSGLTADMIEVDYLKDDGTNASALSNIFYVRVGITGYQHALLIPMLNLTVPVPDFSTTIPSESMGVHPDGSTASCS